MATSGSMFFKIYLIVAHFCAGIVCLMTMPTMVLSQQTTPYSTSPSSSNSTKSGAQDGSKIPLYIGAFFPFGGGWDASGIIPAVEMALDDINARVDILPKYELKMVWNDTQV